MRKYCFLFPLIIVLGCGPIYPLTAGGPYKGKVIDAETKTPIVGAAVLAVWYRHAPGIGSSVDGYLDAEEVLTDNNGEFTVGEHPPASLIPGTWVTGPRIIIFYPNYGFYPVYQISPSPKLGRDELNPLLEQHAVIELPPLNTRDEKRKSMALANPVEVPDTKKLKFNRLLNQQRKELGFEPAYPEK